MRKMLPVGQVIPPQLVKRQEGDPFAHVSFVKPRDQRPIDPSNPEFSTSTVNATTRSEHEN